VTEQETKPEIEEEPDPDLADPLNATRSARRSRCLGSIRRSPSRRRTEDRAAPGLRFNG